MRNIPHGGGVVRGISRSLKPIPIPENKKRGYVKIDASAKLFKFSNNRH